MSGREGGGEGGGRVGMKGREGEVVLDICIRYVIVNHVKLIQFVVREGEVEVCCQGGGSGGLTLRASACISASVSASGLDGG